MIDFFPSRRIAVELFGFGVHWYGIMYLLAFLLALALLPRLQKYRSLSLTQDEWSSVLAAGVLGVLLGGRLGYVFFYAPHLFVSDPLEILRVWNGGMSSHGGFLGVALALLLYVRRHKIPALALADIAVVPAALGLALGRFGNFINLELYGTATSLPWGMAIPGVEGLRHPVQFYAMGKDIFIALVCFAYLARVRPPVPGRTFALFLVLYGALRFLVEFVREQEYAVLSIGVFSLSRGQLLTVPVFLCGLLLWFLAERMGKKRAAVQR